MKPCVTLDMELINIETWISNTYLPTTPPDDITLHSLSEVYDRHRNIPKPGYGGYGGSPTTENKIVTNQKTKKLLSTPALEIHLCNH